METGNYVASVDALDSSQCWYDERPTVAPPGAVLLAVNGPDDVVTFRYTNAGNGVGEVWYPSVADAHAALATEFASLGTWERVPDSEEDAHEYAVRYAATRQGRVPRREA